MSCKTSCDMMPQPDKELWFFDFSSCFGSLKNVSVAEDERKTDSKNSCLPSFLDFRGLEKLRYFFLLTYSSVFTSFNCTTCSCSGESGICRYNRDKLDPNDYFHALKNTHANVPECCVEPYIHSGYMLPHRSWSYYFKVLWIPNNEALNVWTHLIPAFYFLWMFLDFVQTIDLLHAWPLLFVTVGATALTLCSSIAHMFHSRSNYHHCCLFMIDYFGISLCAFSSTTAHFFVGSELSYYDLIGSINLVIFLVIAAVGFFFCSFSQTGRKNSNTHHRQFKLWTNAFGYFYGLIPILSRIATSRGEDDALYYYIFQILCMLASPLLYASDFPQRCWPGKFDIIGHSHQIFHILIAVGCYCDIRAVYIDLSTQRWTELRAQDDYPSIELAIIAVVILSIYCFVVAGYFSRTVRLCFQSEVDAISKNSLGCGTCQICVDSKLKKSQ